LASTTLGAVSLVVKGLIAGKTIEQITGDNPAEFMWDSVVSSGAVGIFSEMSDIVMSAVGTDGSQYKFQKRVEGVVGGPVVGMVGDATRVLGGDVTSMRRLIPYNNLFYIRRLFDKVEESAKGAQ